MSYKVSYYTLALKEDGKIGNIKQSHDHVFTDAKIQNIPGILNGFLKHKKQVGIIEKIEDVGGRVLI